MQTKNSEQLLSLLTALPPGQVARELSLIAHKHQLMVHPNSQKLIPAAVLIPLVKRDNGLHVILTQRTAQLAHHASQISFPGGKLEPQDQSPIAAALREAHEEIGLTEVNVIAELGTYHSYSGFSITSVLGLLNNAHPYRVNPQEVEEVFELPIDMLLHPHPFEHQRVHKLGEWRQYYQIHHQGKHIWGFTGSLLFLLAQWFDQLLKTSESQSKCLKAHAQGN